MAYSPTTWADTPATSSPISAANLNKIETELARLKVNADLDPAAAIAYSKLNLASSIVNADVANAAAIAASKLAAYPSDGTKFLAGDGTWKAASSTTYRKTTAKAVNTTVAATDLLNGEITVAAGVMGTTGLTRLTAFGDSLNNSGGAIALPRFQLVFGATTLFDTGATTAVYNSQVTRYGWKLVAEILNTATNAQVANFLLTLTLNQSGASLTVFTTGEGTYVTASPVGNHSFAIAEGYNTSALDTTAAQTLKLNVINGSASASCETKLTGALVEVI